MRTGGNLENLKVLDYFAAKAMAAMLMSDQYKTESEGDIAQLAYAIAEKMMEMKDEIAEKMMEMKDEQGS